MLLWRHRRRVALRKRSGRRGDPVPVIRQLRRLRPLLVIVALYLLWSGAMSRAVHQADRATRPALTSTTKKSGAQRMRVATVRTLLPRVRARAMGSLPAPVQLPATTAVPGGVLAIGGLDAADTSSAAVVRVGADGTRIAGRLPAALHD